MSLVDELEQAVSTAGTQRRCSVCEALAVMAADERESLQRALNSPLGAKRLSVILRKNDVEVGVPSIHAHRSEGHNS